MSANKNEPDPGFPGGPFLRDLLWKLLFHLILLAMILIFISAIDFLHRLFAP